MTQCASRDMHFSSGLASIEDNCLSSVQFSDTWLDGNSSDRCLVCVTIGYQFLQLQSPSSNEAKCWTDRTRAVYRPLPEWAERMCIIKGDTPLLDIKTHAQPWRKRIGDAGWRRGAVAVADAVSAVSCSVVGVNRGWQVDFTHSHGEEGERRHWVWRILRPTVMATVWVIPAQEWLDSRGLF